MYCSSSSVVRPKVFRPHLDDVERLSYGKGAKKQRGTGSKYHCHRLNQEERKLFELAKKNPVATATVMVAVVSIRLS